MQLKDDLLYRVEAFSESIKLNVQKTYICGVAAKCPFAKEISHAR